MEQKSGQHTTNDINENNFYKPELSFEVIIKTYLYLDGLKNVYDKLYAEISHDRDEIGQINEAKQKCEDDPNLLFKITLENLRYIKNISNIRLHDADQISLTTATTNLSQIDNDLALFKKVIKKHGNQGFYEQLNQTHQKIESRFKLGC